MELKELNYVTAINECGSISKAAKKLSMAQSSLSHFLKNYEKQIGYEIFIRSNGGLRPTYEGELYLKAADSILNIKKKLSNEIDDVSNLKRGKVIFSISSPKAPYLLPQVIPKFKEKYENIDVEIIEADIAYQETLLQHEKVDVALVSLPLVNTRLKYDLIFKEEVLLCAHKSFGLNKIAKTAGKTGKPWIDLNELKDLPFLTFNVSSLIMSELFDKVMKKYKDNLKINNTKNSFNTVLSLVKVGVGTTLMPELYTYKNKDLEYYSIGPEGLYRSLALAYPPSGYLSKATKVFSEIIMSSMREENIKSRNNYDIYKR
ncbi:LysR family transcriptional regulator [uncultured Ilyobacter sp.]|uniref:LysR family transcriptional regulator n=1 Tax=uncultured Ilyobacter sp. TaxID=544433 RepID=UPI0029BFF871|nr:LysR family transcriptional regulator [uncultured Ilyobacter sp.]